MLKDKISGKGHFIDDSSLFMFRAQFVMKKLFYSFFFSRKSVGWE